MALTSEYYNYSPPEYIPDFFIIGAPKCGTTALFKYLEDNPDIFLPPVKEPDFFATDMNMANDIKTAEEYTALFDKASSKLKTGEASVWYLYSKQAVSEIIRLKPDAKFIAMVRNPVEMFQSLHAQALYTQFEKEKTPEKAWK
mgnify:FL=1